MEEQQEEKLLSVKDAAEQLGYTPQHTRYLIKMGKINALKVGGWRTMIAQAEVDRIRAGQTKVEPLKVETHES